MPEGWECEKMSFIEILGILAGALTTLGLIPQVVHIFTLRSAREISLLFAFLFLGGIALWLLYGIWLGLLPSSMGCHTACPGGVAGIWKAKIWQISRSESATYSKGCQSAICDNRFTVEAKK
jgi:MtN3 and saliva related transmembrane protein